MDIPTYEQQRKTPAQSPVQARMRVYLLGVGEGLKLANAALVARGERPLYCLPGETVLGVDDYLKMIDAALPSARSDARLRDQSVEALVLRTLQGRYGCGGAPASEGPASAPPGAAPATREQGAGAGPGVAEPVPSAASAADDQRGTK